MLAADLSRIADVEYFRIIQFFVTHVRCVGTQAAQSLQEASTLAQLAFEMCRVGAIDQEVRPHSGRWRDLLAGNILIVAWADTVADHD